MEETLSKLNPEQRQAVENVDGPVLVVAGAGSGKTRVITTRIMYLIEKGTSPYQILAMTFTNKAALEMKTRVAELLNQSMRDLTVTTFHSFCARFLRREISVLERDPGFAIFDTQDQTTCLRRVLKSLDLPEKSFPAGAYRNKISYYKNLGDAAVEPKADLDREIYRAYQQALLDQNAVDFDDLLLLTVKILEEHEDVRQRYQQRFRYIMVDEYQDTNIIQARLVNLILNEDRNICVVGDEDQSIYGWRGADIRNILEFETHYPDARIYKLEQNYRSTQNILDYANEVISQNQLRKPKKLWTAVDGGAPIHIKDEWTARNESENIVQNIQRLSRSEKKAYSEFAILFRSNYLSRNLEEMCRRYKIPYQLIGGLKFYDRKEIKDLLSFMRIIVNPRDWTSFTRAIGVPTRGVGDKSLDKLFVLFNQGLSIPELLREAIKNKTISGRGLKGIKDFVALYDILDDAQHDHKPHEWLKLLIDELDYREYLKKHDEVSVDDRVGNVDELIESMREYESQGVTSLAQFMDFSALVNDQDEYDPEKPRVSLMTIHAAKGLEFDTVFVIGLEDGVFPNQRSLNDNPNALEEERRLFYVAVTRARQRLYLSYSRRRQTFGTTTSNPKSRFLIPPTSQARTSNDDWSDSDEPFIKPKKKVKIADLSDQLSSMKAKLAEKDIDVDFSHIGGKKSGRSSALRPGDTVRHKVFGTGTVSMVRGRGENLTVSVYFPGRGKKTLVARMAKLEKLN